MGQLSVEVHEALEERIKYVYMNVSKTITSSKCPICTSNNSTQLYKSDIDLRKLSFTYVKTPNSGKTFRSVRCNNCTHVYCDPIPKNMYKNYKDVVDKQYLKYVESIRFSAEKILPIIKKYKKSGLILDVGCATGEFLTIARRYDYSVEGLELSRWSSNLARRKKLKIHNDKLEILSKRFSNKYDIITLFGVIEHFENPLSEMKHINKLLKKDGLLVIWTGDINSISSRLLGRSWWYWQGQHIQYFSHKSLSLLGEMSGVRGIATKVFPFIATYGLLDNSLSRYWFRPYIMWFIKPFFRLKSKWTIYLPGEMLWFGRKFS